jgi:hypothetical protein
MALEVSNMASSGRVQARFNNRHCAPTTISLNLTGTVSVNKTN